MSNVKIKINGKQIEVSQDSTLLSACQQLEIEIPTLCSHKALTPYGSCRVCLVEVSQGARASTIQTSCTYPASDGLVVLTDTGRVKKTRSIMLELLLARCPDSAQIKEMAKKYGVKENRIKPKNKDCILCGLCVRMCHERMGSGAISFVGRGTEKEIKSPFGKPNEVCITCGACDFICPTGKLILKDASRQKQVPIPFEFNRGLIARPAVYIPYPQAVPNVANVDEGSCVRLLTGECGICKEICEAEAIDYEQKNKLLNINAGAVILTNGVELFDANIKKEYGYDRYANVITSIELERILSSSGPTRGDVIRPSDGRQPKRIAFIQCVGSRDPSCGNEFCSSVCCMYSIKEAIIAKEHDPDIESTIFFIDIRSFGKDFERYYENAKEAYGVKFVRSMVSKIYEQPKSKNLMVKYMDDAGKMQEAEFDLVTLAVGMTDTGRNNDLAKKLSIELDEYGFCKTSNHSPGRTSKDGVFVAGTYADPKDIPETVTEASSAAALASALLKNARGTLVKPKEYPPERDVADEDMRVGVFVCRCGRNIASVVNVPEVVEHASKIKGVAFATEFLYSCSKDALDEIKKAVLDHNLNRVVVASCTPRTHEELFRDTVREAGLNRYLFEMTSLREQVSWVHKDDAKWATKKSKELVDMMVAKTKLVKPLKRELVDVVQKALVIGGGASGMHAALTVAEQGFETYLIEKEEKLGGHLRELFYDLEGTNMRGVLEDLVKKVTTHDKIHVMTKSYIKEFAGFLGNYHSVIDSSGEKKEIDHGVVIVAAGAHTYQPKPDEYGFGKSSNIISQVDLEKNLFAQSENFSGAQTFVMIQCVGSRNDEHPYCSRVCCSHAIKNALKLKSINPDHKITILYRDIRTFGLLEKYYVKAREEGVVFSFFDKDKEPHVKTSGNKIVIRHFDKLLQDEINLEVDWLILSTGAVADEKNELAKILKVPLTADNFFLEAHAKIRPLDFTTEGMYVCGMAHSPRLLPESLAQAQGASVRAATVLSKDKISSQAITATVNKRVCKGCGLCVSVCPFSAREIDEETNTAKVIDVLCQGCGACAVVCPSGATEHKGFNKKQIMSMIDKAV